jgi:hypothetical protein
VVSGRARFHTDPAGRQLGEDGHWAVLTYVVTGPF